MSEYDRQAVHFLKKWGVTFRVAFVDTACPPFCDGKHIHGHKYQVTLRRNGRQVRFNFWNSLNDANEGKEPTAYDVLACASSDLCCPDKFEDFCDEYGYDVDSRKAEKTWRLCLAQSERLQTIFDGEEIRTALCCIN